MSHLKTDWLCVATEGDTVDGRKIPRQWVIDMGETYNINHYGALIWPEHERSQNGNYGEVLEATWQDGEDGLARLYVSLCPNIRLIFSNLDGQMLYFSIEPEENWRGSGRTYLKGLAVTDMPASVGTTRLRFSQRKYTKRGYYRCVITPDGKFKQEGLMRNWQKLFGIKPKFEDEGAADDSAQGDDKLQALANVVNDMEARLAKIEAQLNSVEEDVNTIAEAVDTEEFSQIRDNAKEIVKRFSELNKKNPAGTGRNIKDKSGKFSFL